MRIEISDPGDPRLALYRGVADPELLAREGRFVAEGRLVVRRLLASSRFDAESVLVTAAAFAEMADVLEPAGERLPVYVASRDLLVHVAGFNIHRGCLALGRRPAPADVAALLPPESEPALVVVLEALANADNVGGVFRNAHAFGASAVLLDGATCDPLYRKAIRTSMGASLAVPFARVTDWPRGLQALRSQGFKVVALTPRGDVDIAEVAQAADLKVRATTTASLPAGLRPRPTAASEPGTNQEPGTPNGPGTRNEAPRTWTGTPRTAVRRVAVLVGNEGRGLSEAAEAMADVRVRIPMAAGADSLNAATAAGIALHAFARYCGLLVGVRS